jgi:hypothetical protein
MVIERLQTKIIVLVVMAVFMACRLPGSPSVGSSPTPQKEAEKVTATTEGKKETSAPTTPPTAAAAPTTSAQPPAATQPSAPTQPPAPASITAGATRLNFIPWSTSVYVNSEIKKGDVKKYVIDAMKGQLMMITLDSPNNDVVFDLNGVSEGLVAISVKAWDYRLPATQDYVISVKAGGGDSNFGLNVVVPANISFNPGAISAIVKGHVQESSVNTYLARATEGQTMTVKITSPSSDVLLTIYGYDDGSPLVRHVSGATEWSGKLPATQDYVIQAISVGGETDYSIKVTIQ